MLAWSLRCWRGACGAGVEPANASARAPPAGNAVDAHADDDEAWAWGGLLEAETVPRVQPAVLQVSG